MTPRDGRLRVLQLNTSDRGGGAEAVAWNLHRRLAERGVASRLAVGRRRSGAPDVTALPRSPLRDPGARLAAQLDRLRGREDFRFPASARLLRRPGLAIDVVHAHNLHGGYFDLRLLPELSQRRPTLVTLHDGWLLSGHCAYSLGCERWRQGCGSCPHLDVYP
nr:glycosyltransferase [Myxococcota bacterium]